MILAAKARIAFGGEPRLMRLEKVVGPDDFAAETLGQPDETHRISLNSAGASDITLSPDFGYLAPGDIWRVNPISQEVRVLYREASRHNVLFFTGGCTSRCLMCSQPPREIND